MRNVDLGKLSETRADAINDSIARDDFFDDAPCLSIRVARREIRTGSRAMAMAAISERDSGWPFSSSIGL